LLSDHGLDQLFGGEHAAVRAEHAAHRRELAVLPSTAASAGLAGRESWHGDLLLAHDAAFFVMKRRNRRSVSRQ
jgi:hypothetical protein